MFESIKDKFLITPVLIMQISVKEFSLDIDASEYAVRAVLFQLREDGVKYPFA